MKRTLLLMLLPLVMLFTGGFTADSNTSIVIKKGKITINGVNIENWQLTQIKQALGEPERPMMGYNKTHTYDSKGIVLFEPVNNEVPSGKVSEMQLYYSFFDAGERNPKNTYIGKVIIDKLTLNPSLSLAQVRSKLKKWKETDSYMEHVIRLASNGIYIYFRFSDDEKSLQKISIGVDK